MEGGPRNVTFGLYVQTLAILNVAVHAGEQWCLAGG